MIVKFHTWLQDKGNKRRKHGDKGHNENERSNKGSKKGQGKEGNKRDYEGNNEIGNNKRGGGQMCAECLRMHSTNSQGWWYQPYYVVRELHGSTRVCIQYPLKALDNQLLFFAIVHSIRIWNETVSHTHTLLVKKVVGNLF